MNRNLLFVILSLFTWGMGEGLFIYFQPIYLQELGADPVLIGGLLGAMGIAMALAQIPSGILADKIGSRSMMWASWTLGTLAAFLMAMARSLPGFCHWLDLVWNLCFFHCPDEPLHHQRAGQVHCRPVSHPCVRYLQPWGSGWTCDRRVDCSAVWIPLCLSACQRYLFGFHNHSFDH